MKRLYFLLLLCPVLSQAQSHLTLYNLPLVPQRLAVNPAFSEHYNFYAGIPGISAVSASAGNTGFSLSKLLKRTDDDSLELTMDAWLENARKKTNISARTHISILNTGFKTKIGFFDFFINERANFNFIVPVDYFDLAWNGISKTGEHFDLGAALYLNHYREYGAGYTYKFKDLFRAGIRVKYLYGLENIHTKRSDISLSSSDEMYHLTGKSDFSIKSSGIRSIANLDPSEKGAVKDYLFKKHNRGAAFDFGFYYNLKKWTFSASILDLGGIRWKDDTHHFSSRNTEEFTFRGMDIGQVLKDSLTLEEAGDRLLDSVVSYFDIDSTKGSYTSNLPLQHYGGINYHFTNRTEAGLLLYGYWLNGKLYSSATIAGTTRIKRWFSVTANYTMGYQGFNVFGAGFSLRVWKLQWYVACDNALGIFDPEGTRYVQLQTGLNMPLSIEKTPKKE
ncbi:MAG: DUF5723 family protein [Bacteroidia bacterium]